MTEWVVDMNNHEDATTLTTVYAVCGSVADWSIQAGPVEDNPAGMQSTAHVQCPSGTVFLSGAPVSSFTGHRGQHETQGSRRVIRNGRSPKTTPRRTPPVSSSTPSAPAEVPLRTTAEPGTRPGRVDTRNASWPRYENGATPHRTVLREMAAADLRRRVTRDGARRHRGFRCTEPRGRARGSEPPPAR